jgi:NAD(P)H-nitrite reductase large subunit
MEMPGKLKLGVSGCPNQCAETCIKDVGLVGRSNGWTVMAGGNGGAKPRLAIRLADGLSTDDALALVDRIIGFYRETAKRHERLGRMIERIGDEAFRAAVLGDRAEP